MATTPVFLPGKSHEQRSLVNYSPQGHKELDTTEQLNNSNVTQKKKTKYLYRGMGFPGGSVVQNPPANAGDAGSIPGLGRTPEEGNGNHSSILAWEIPLSEEPGRLRSMRSLTVGHN